MPSTQGAPSAVMHFTIASVRTQQGLKPVLTSEELLAHLPELNELCCPDTLALSTPCTIRFRKSPKR